MVQEQQYQVMVEGFASHLFEWYTAVIIWKSQSPWPSLRGALYDHYMETTGGYWGVRRATRAMGSLIVSSRIKNTKKYIHWNENAGSRPLHVQLDVANLTCSVINRGYLEYKNFSALEATVHHVVSLVYRDLLGNQIGKTQVRGAGFQFLPTSASRCDGEPFTWPNIDEWGGGTLLLDLKLSQKVDIEGSAGSIVLATNGYWLSDRSVCDENASTINGSNFAYIRKPSATPDYHDLKLLQSELVDLNVNGSVSIVSAPLSALFAGSLNNFGPRVELNVTIDLEHTGKTPSAVAFWVTLSLLRPCNVTSFNDHAGEIESDFRVLPTYWSDNSIVMLPGTFKRIRATADVTGTHASGAYRVEVGGWNIRSNVIDLAMSE
jgi:hypothetical protein